MSSALAIGLFFLCATIASGTLFEIDTHPWAMATAGVFLLVTTVARSSRTQALFIGKPTPLWSIQAGFFGVLACTPTALGLLFSLNQEFPFAGDASFHISTHFNTALYWVLPVGNKIPNLEHLDVPRARALAFLVVISIVFFVSKKVSPKTGLLVFSVLMFAWSAFDSFAFTRYPGLVYFLGIPINILFYLLLPNEVATAPRLIAYLALPVWLFVLRPIIVGRVPDARGVMAALLLFWGERQIYWQSAPYLETWAMCGVLLALETLHDRGRRGATVACLCIGAAACAKEQAILFLPFVWLAGVPWQRSDNSAPRRSDLMLAGFAAGLPFVFHLLLRASAGGERNLGMYGVEPLPVIEGAAIWISRVPLYFADAAYIPLVFAFVGMGVALSRPEWRGGTLAGLGGALAAFLLYALDSMGPDGFVDSLAGYYRFSAPILPGLTVGVFALVDRLGSEKFGLALVAAVAIAQTPTAISGVRLMASESERRSGLEDGNGTIYLPLRALLDAAERDGAIDRQTTIVVASPTPFVAYHRAATNGRDLRFVDANGFECGCSIDRPAAIAAYLLRSPRAAEFAGLPRVAEIPVAPGTRGSVGAPPEAYPACLAAFESTCRYVRTRKIDGIPTGTIGVGVR